MNPSCYIVGIQPWFPGIIGRWRWLTEAIPAERVAAVRIATALALLVDLLMGYLPEFKTLFSAGELGGRDLYPARFHPQLAYWSILRWLPDSWGPSVLMAVWFGSACALLVGWRPLIAGLVTWVCAVSFWNINPGINNGGDRLRNTLLLMVSMSCSGAVWGVSSKRRKGDSQPVFVPGWPMKILVVQLMVLYFFGGLYKLMNPAWRNGYVMYFVGHDLAWCTTPTLAEKLPIWALRLTAWFTIVWELGFPALVLIRRTRVVTLCLGAFFHLMTFFTLEVGAFALYALAYYPMFLPWERVVIWWSCRQRSPVPLDAD